MWVVPAELHYNLGKNDVKLEKQHVKNELEKTGNGNCQLLWGLSDNTTCREFKNYLQGIHWGQSFSVSRRELGLKEVAFIAGTSENPADQKNFYYFFH